MPRRPRTVPRAAELGDLQDPRGFAALLVEHLTWLRVHNYSERTVPYREKTLVAFALWCGERGIRRPVDVTRGVVERYQRHLFHHRKKDGQPLAFQTQVARLVPLKTFFKWLAKERHVLYDPAGGLELPKAPVRIPGQVLTPEEVERLLSYPDVATASGLRDRAMLETLYSTAMRRLELSRLKLHDLDPARGSLFIRQGKGGRDRVVPIGERAIAWILKYLEAARPRFVTGADDGWLFLGQRGGPYPPEQLTAMVRRLLKDVGIAKPGSCHLFRHTAATLMLENGADIRFVQALLGHVQLNTTAIYTRVAIRKLKEIHTATHPGARLRRRGGTGGAGGGGAEACGQPQPELPFGRA